MTAKLEILHNWIRAHGKEKQNDKDPIISMLELTFKT